MAKRANDTPTQIPARKIRYFEIEASDETIQKALETFDRMQKPIEVLPPLRRRLTAASTAGAEESLFDQGHEIVDGVATEVNGEADQNTEPAPKRERGEGGSKNYNAGIDAVGDVNFYPESKQSLKEFFAEKKPTTDKNRCLVFCFYLQEILQLPQYGAGHILAAFNEIPKEIPADLPGTLRNMRVGKSGSKGWLEIPSLDNIRVTTAGINQVRHKMGEAKPGDGAK